MKLRLFVLLLLLPVTVFPQKKNQPQQRQVKIQNPRGVTQQQEIQLGKEAAAQVEKSMEVVKNPTVEAWLNRIGGKLAKTPEANAYPYYFKLVNEESINAFALPGGPMYVHTGLLKAADSESQVAGVLAHEMSHVALRHGVAQMSKAQTMQTLFGLAGAAAGMTGSGLISEIGQIGSGLGLNLSLTKFSRDYERDADLNGARMMASAGYNPLDLAGFFEKLQAEMGSAGQPKGLEKWFTDHPAPANRRQYIEEDAQFYPARQYTASTGDFAKVQQAVNGIPPPKKRPAQLLQPVQNAQARQGLPQGYRDLQLAGFAIAYPDGWQPGQSKGGGGIYIAPQGGVVQSQRGGIELIAGALLDYYEPQSASVELQPSTNALLQALKQGDQNLRAESPQKAQVGGKPALMTRLTTRVSTGQDPNQVVYFYTVARPEALWTLALAAPQSQAQQAEPLFQQIVKTVHFPD